MKINKKQFRHKIIYNMDSACINSVSLGTRKRNEMMVKTKENFKQLTNYQSLEENVFRLGFFSTILPKPLFYFFTVLSCARWLIASWSQNGCCHPRYHVLTSLHSSQAGRSFLFVIDNRNLLRRPLQQVTPLVSAFRTGSHAHSQVCHGERKRIATFGVCQLCLSFSGCCCYYC